MGKLIVFEGIDGSGKSTQFRRICARLESEGRHFKKLTFPRYQEQSSALIRMYLGGAFGENPGDVNAYAASTFYAVDRFASYIQDWREAYLAGSLILADRYTTSNAIHQMAKLPFKEWDSYLAWLEQYEYELLSLPRPDVVAFLDMPPAVSQRLLSRRYAGDESRKDIHERNCAYLEGCRRSAVYAAERLGWKVIPCAESEDAEEPYPESEITSKLIALLP
jgi:dTMP kinase